MNNQEYEQKRSECWIEFCKTHPIETPSMSIGEAFAYSFDRAYALGKLQASCGQVKETITQEDVEKASVEYADKTAKQYEVCNSEFVQEIMVAFEQGANFALGKQEKDADTVIQGWVAADDDGDLFLYRTKPARDEVSGMWMSHECPLDVGINLFPNLTWESDPEPVEIIIKRKKK